MHVDIQEAELQVNNVIHRYNNTVAKVQSTCAHEHLEECEYQHSNYFSSLPPLRVCTDCGLSEIGWGPGYIILKGRAGVFPRKEVYAQCRGFFISDKHKGPLLRKEITLEQLIKGAI